MPHELKPKLYRDVIDALVKDCSAGQGQIGPNRVRNGLWNQSATADSMPDEHRFNELLSPQDRETVAKLLAQQYLAQPLEILEVLHAHGIHLEFSWKN